MESRPSSLLSPPSGVRLRSTNFGSWLKAATALFSAFSKVRSSKESFSAESTKQKFTICQKRDRGYNGNSQNDCNESDAAEYIIKYG